VSAHDSLRRFGGHYELCPTWQERDCDFEDGVCNCTALAAFADAVRADERNTCTTCGGKFNGVAHSNCGDTMSSGGQIITYLVHIPPEGQ